MDCAQETPRRRRADRLADGIAFGYRAMGAVLVVLIVGYGAFSFAARALH